MGTTGTLAALPQLLANGLVDGVLIASLSLGFGLLHSATRFFAFTFGASFAYAAYAYLVIGSYLGPVGAGAAAVLAASALGVLLDRLVYARLRRRSAAPVVAMIASIGLYVVLQNLLSLAFGDATCTLRGSGSPATLEVVGARLSSVRVASAWIAVAALAAVGLLLQRSNFGQRLRAVADDPELAAATGLPRERTILGATVVGSGLAGLVGVLTGLDQGVVPTMGFHALLLAVVASIIGGLGTASAVVLGGLLLGILQQAVGWVLPTEWRDAVTFVALIVCLLAKPQGLFRGSRSTGPS